MPDSYNYLEKIGGRSPWSAAMPSRGPSRSNWVFYLGDDGTGTYPAITSPFDLWAAMKEVGGYTEEHPDGIRIARTLPRSHPWFPWLFVDDFTSITGLGRMTKVAPDPIGLLETPTFDNTAQYRLWEFEKPDGI